MKEIKDTSWVLPPFLLFAWVIDSGSDAYGPPYEVVHEDYLHHYDPLSWRAWKGDYHFRGHRNWEFCW